MEVNSTGESYQSPVATEAINGLEEAHNHHQTLIRSLDLLRSMLLSQTDGQSFKYHLERAKIASDQIGSFLFSLRNPTPQPASSFLKVISLPELLEHILYIEPSDLLKTQQVNKTFSSTIYSSMRLQQDLSLLSDPDCFFTMLDHRFLRPFNYHIRNKPRRQPEFALQIVLHATSTPQNLRSGSRIQSMLISQPPLFQLEARMICACASIPPTPDNPTPGKCTIRSKTDFTVRELWETAERLRFEHRMCPHSQIHWHTEDGFVRTHVYFDVALVLKEGDPRVVRERERERSSVERKAGEDKKAARMGPYVAAKQAAHAAGEPIPTLAEFEAAQA